MRAMPLCLIASLALSAPALAQTAPAAPTAPATAAPPPALNIRTTRDLVALCNTPDSDPGYPGAIGLCVGYGSGVIDFYFADTRAHVRTRKVCLPNPPPTRGEARKMFVAWAEDNEKWMDEPAVQGVMRFAISAFPCGK